MSVRTFEPRDHLCPNFATAPGDPGMFRWHPDCKKCVMNEMCITVYRLMLDHMMKGMNE